MPIKARSEDAKTPLARVAFANGLFKLREKASKKGIRKEYQCTLLYPKGSDISSLQKLVGQAAEEAWPGKAKALAESGVLKNPILDGDGPQGASKKTGKRHEGFAGQHFIRVATGEDYPPKLVNQKVRPITSQSELKSGDYGYPVIHAMAWEDDEGGKGISFGISMFQKAKDGDALGGGDGADPDKMFEAIPDEGDAPASTKTGEGAAGLFG